MDKLLKTLLIIGVLFTSTVAVMSGLPPKNTEPLFYWALLFLVVGYYLANYSNYRKLGVSITLVASFPYLFIIVGFFVAMLLGLIFPSPPGVILD